MMGIEKLILSNLAYNEAYVRKVIPFLKDEYFHEQSDKIIYSLIDKYFKQYNSIPHKDALMIDLEGLALEESLFDQTNEKIKELETLFTVSENKIEWLVDNTEKFCKDKAIYNAIMESIKIIDGKNKKYDKGAIPKLLEDALGVSFDTQIGHDYLHDWEERYEYYHRIEEKIPFDLHMFNEITKGGFSKKTLNVFIAGTGVGKTFTMCHMAGANLCDNRNVLYITMEISEEEIARRIDANLMGVHIDDLAVMTKDTYQKRIERIKTKAKGKLVIKEYAIGSAGVHHFSHLINELKMKLNFIPDIIYVDYLNLCVSTRIKDRGASYDYVKAIAEELRGLGQIFNVPVVTATQFNRTGYSSSDAGLTETSESFGLPMTADFMCAIISDEELEEMGQFVVKQLKSRYDNIANNRRFTIGVDKTKMTLYDVESTENNEDYPVIDNSKFGDGLKREDKMKNKFVGIK